MKTLDEVIKGFECCQNVECDECPYKILFNDDTHVPCDQLEKEDDALHYLNEYRTLQYGYIKAMADLEDNPPLTWEELKQMEGKPVWIEESAENGLWWTYWVIWEGDNAVLPKKDYSTKWKAYRKEQE